MMNKYIYPRKEDIEIVVGDEKQDRFYPRMKIKRWDNEVNFSVGVISKHQGSDKHINDRVEWNDGHGTKARFYEKEGDEFEFEIELASKPASNVIHLSIESKGLDFFYQTLTQEDKDAGWSGEERSYGSYAVYHSTMQGNYLGGNNYRAGKFCHIYRPYVTDSEGWEVWCDLNIDTDMTITIPQDFIDKAVYPIIIDPIFGDQGVGTWNNPHNPNWMRGGNFTSPANIDVAQSISLYCLGYDTKLFKGVIVLVSDEKIIANGVTASANVAATTTWYTAYFGTDPNLANSTPYYLSFVPDYYITIYADLSTSPGGMKDESNNYTTPTDPTDLITNNRRYSVYCTYQEAAVGGGGGIISNSFAGPFVGPLGGPI